MVFEGYQLKQYMHKRKKYSSPAGSKKLKCIILSKTPTPHFGAWNHALSLIYVVEEGTLTENFILIVGAWSALQKVSQQIFLKFLEAQDSERVLHDLHHGPVRGQFKGSTTIHKVMCVGFY